MTARDRLAGAALARVEAIRRRDEAATTLSRASAFTASVQHDLDTLRAADEADTAFGADDLVEALRAGATPTFASDRPMGASAIATRDAERRLAAARRAADVLSAELKRAESALAEAEAKHKRAVHAVIIDEANSIAEAVERLEAAAAEQRARLGGQYGRLSQIKDMPAALHRVIGGSDFVTNTPMWRLAQDANIRLKDFEEKLLSDPNAMLA